MNKHKAILIGGAVVDVLGVPDVELNDNSKNFGSVSILPGGVSFNIASNLSRLGKETSLVSVFCNDSMSEVLKKSCAKNNIDISNSRYMDDCTTPMFMCITDSKGEIKAAISATKLFKELTIDFLKTKIEYINSFGVCVIDGNSTENVFQYLFDNVKVPIYVDPVSADHSHKLIKYIKKAYAIKPNLLEAEVLSGIKIKDENDLKKACDYFIGIGVQEVFISMADKGVCYANKDKFRIISKKPDVIVNTNGAGDSMMAGLIYGHLSGYDISKKAKLGVAVANITLQSKSTINKNLNIENALFGMEEIQ